MLVRHIQVYWLLKMQLQGQVGEMSNFLSHRPLTTTLWALGVAAELISEENAALEQMLNDWMVMMYDLITLSAASYKCGKSLGVGSIAFCISSMDERVSLLVPGCSENQLKYSTGVLSTLSLAQVAKANNSFTLGHL